MSLRVVAEERGESGSDVRGVELREVVAADAGDDHNADTKNLYEKYNKNKY